MTTSAHAGRRSRSLWIFALLILSLIRPTLALADDHDSAMREAAKHFRRGVALYTEADYRSAVVEFKRAYTLVPNTATLFNVGEAQYQLLDYAAALTTFEQYLAEAGLGDSHFSEVQKSVEVLKTRVGRLIITTIPTGAEITIDDLSVGTTPLDRTIIVNIGPRKVSATLSGRVTLTRQVEVAAEDNVAVSFELPLALVASPLQVPSPVEWSARESASGARSSGFALRVAGFVTSAVLAAGAVTCGALALGASNELAADRDRFPVAESVLAHDSQLTKKYSIAADSLAVAALVIGGVTLYSTLAAGSRPSSSAARSASRLRVGPGSAVFETSF